MSSYNTEQKKLLEEFMAENRDRSFTIDEIIEGLRGMRGESEIPGRSTVYRLIGRLTEEGKVRKFVKTDSRKASYQLVAGQHCDCHLHLKCVGCGKLFHMDEEISDELVRRISAFSNFSVDEEATVLFGKCAVCGNR